MESSRVSKLSLAQVHTIDFQALNNNDQEQQSRLFQACCDDGFFYITMAGTAVDIEAAIDDIYKLEEQLFSLPESVLLHYDIDKLSPTKLNGYKPLGRNHGEIAGRKDGFQSYAIPKDGVMRLGSLADFERPPVIDDYLHALQTFASAITKAAKVILSSLSKSLYLEVDKDFCNSHRSHLPSLDLIRLLRYHAQPPSEQGSSHVPHTDLGSMTFLFTRQFGLQILSAKTGHWEWIEPREGHATVNVGDCLSLLTSKKFLSCKHRVKALPGQAMRERYSFAYFMRPDEDTPMKPVANTQVSITEKHTEVFTSGEWLRRKYAMLRKDTWTKENDWILRGE